MNIGEETERNLTNKNSNLIKNNSEESNGAITLTNKEMWKNNLNDRRFGNYSMYTIPQQMEDLDEGLN